MDLRFTSKEIIKPCSPTPNHQRTHKLSLIDQLTPGGYFSMILFYSGPLSHQDTMKTSDHLKKSLSETLTLFYPFAGKYKNNNLFVDCNDDGVTFIETHLAGDMSEVIKQAKNDILGQLIPYKPHETTKRIEVNLLVQVNYFGCGGMAIGICFHHKIADGVTAANFVKSWGIIARGADNNDFNKDVVYDSNSIFPARVDLPDMSSTNNTGLGSLDSVVKRFTFDGTKIASLREKIVNESSYLVDHHRPTRVEVVSSVILSAVLAAYKRGDDDECSVVTAIIAVDLRKRMNPPLPEHSFGNISTVSLLNLPTDDDDDDKKVDYCSLAGEIHRSIKTVDDQYVRKLYGEGEALKMLKGRASTTQGLNKKSNKVFVITSWCKFPFNEADFGWGKPMSIGLGKRFTQAAILVDSCSDDGQGLEAWIGLSDRDMTRFQQHPAILAYASL